jgi:hypothetical protein
MIRNFFPAIILVCLVIFYVKPASAQTDSSFAKPTYKVAIFAPLYLDSVFNNNNFKYKQGMPHFIMPAVDFIQGAQIALDSMQLKNENVEVAIYDSKAYTKNINWLIQNQKLDSVKLIIGSVKETDFKQLAEFAFQKKIPFISATYPNDGGISANPYVVILNPTLKAHCDAIYSYILQNHGTDKIFLCRQNGSQEDMVAGFIKQMNEQDGKPLLNIETLNFEGNINPDYLKSKLDSNRQNILIGGSLDETFATGIANACFKLDPPYPITLIGMPNWDGMAGLHKKEMTGNFPVYFTTPYFNAKLDDNSRILTNGYAKKYKAKPSDMAFKGFETINLFINLLINNPDNLMSNLNTAAVKTFCEYNIRPVLLKKDNTTPDYFENKHLYFIKILNGVETKAW